MWDLFINYKNYEIKIVYFQYYLTIFTNEKKKKTQSSIIDWSEHLPPKHRLYIWIKILIRYEIKKTNLFLIYFKSHR